MDWDVVIYLGVALAVGVVGFLLEWKRGHRVEEQMRAMELAYTGFMTSTTKDIERLREKVEDLEDADPGMSKEQGEEMRRRMEQLAGEVTVAHRAIQQLQEEADEV